MRVPHLGTITGCGAALMLLCAQSLCSQTVKTKVSYSLVYSRIDATEPVLLRLEFSNITDGALKLNLGWDQRDQIYFTATSPSGNMEIHEPPPTSFDPVGRFGEVVIPAKGGYTQVIVLSQWASFAAPGDYVVELHLRGALGLQTSGALLVQTEAVSLTVDSDAASLVQRHCTEEWNRLKSAHDGGEAMDAALFLGNVRSAAAVPFMSDALNTEHATAIGGILITGLARIRNLSAVQALTIAMNGTNGQNAQSAQKALAQIALERNSPEVAKQARLALDARSNTSKP